MIHLHIVPTEYLRVLLLVDDGILDALRELIFNPIHFLRVCAFDV